MKIFEWIQIATLPCYWLTIRLIGIPICRTCERYVTFDGLDWTGRCELCRQAS